MIAKAYKIGCSGYYYSSWRRKFYPESVKPKDWLSYYSTVFNTVELNGTFYRTPKISDFKRYAATTPGQFTFSVKVSRYITHVLKLKESKQAVLDLQHLVREGLSEKVSCFLFQLPPSFHYTEENLERILENIPHDPVNIIEFRHESWWTAKVHSELEKARITFCNIDHPQLKVNFVHTTPRFYLRLHGNPELFKSSYSEKELHNFYRKFPDDSKSYNIYFNNTFYEAGYTNAQQLMAMINKTKDA